MNDQEKYEDLRIRVRKAIAIARGQNWTDATDEFLEMVLKSIEKELDK